MFEVFGLDKPSGQITSQLVALAFVTVTLRTTAETPLVGMHTHENWLEHRPLISNWNVWPAPSGDDPLLSQIRNDGAGVNRPRVPAEPGCEVHPWTSALTSVLPAALSRVTWPLAPSPTVTVLEIVWPAAQFKLELGFGIWLPLGNKPR